MAKANKSNKSNKASKTKSQKKSTNLNSQINLNNQAEFMLVEKKEFQIQNYQTFGGKTIENVKVGWESYGELNAKKDNAILVCHPFSGNSHAAGKYAQTDAEAGYWDSIIGAGKAIDTNKFFVLSVDSLVNLNYKDPNVITTGPASINPKTQKPYGMDFPIVTIRDFVNLQKAVVESLGIKKLHAVVGASMGSMQTYEWAATYPQMVGKIMPAIGAAFASSHLIALTQTWAMPILLDKNWNNGDYYDKQAPIEGIKASLKSLILSSLSYKGLNKNYKRQWTLDDKNPLEDFANSYKVSNYFDTFANMRSEFVDANHFLYIVKANQLYSAGHNQDNFLDGIKNIKAPTLLIYSDLDVVFYPDEIKTTRDLIKANGAKIKTLKLSGTSGHLDGLLQIHKLSDKIKKFIE